jgi:hypothetical protein
MRTAHNVVPPVLQFSRSYMDPVNSGSVIGVPRARDESDARLFLFRSYAFPSTDHGHEPKPLPALDYSDDNDDAKGVARGAPRDCLRA